MRSSLRSFITFAALGFLGAVASGTAVASEPEPSIADGRTAAPRTAHGVVQMIGEALAELTLTPEQETAVKQMGAEVEPLQVKVDQAENALLLTLAEQVNTKHIDRTALEASIATYATERHNLAVPLRSALERLHQMLDAEQRADFADALACRVHAARVAMTGERLDEFETQLELSDAQKQQLHDILQGIRPLIQAERTSIHAAIEAFRGETFAVETFLPLNEVANSARARAERIIGVTEQLVAILDAHQRDLLAARIIEAARARSIDEEAIGAPQEHAKESESVGTANQHMWAAAGVRRGPFGGVRAGVAVGGRRPIGAAGFYYGRVRAYPVAAGWGWGW